VTEIQESAKERFSALTVELGKLGRPVIESAKSSYFGDYLVTGKWPGIELRLVRDKGVDSFDFRPSLANEEWFDLRSLIGLMKASDAPDRLTVEEQMEIAARRLADVVSALQPENWPGTRRGMELLEEQRARRSFGY